MTCDFVPRFQEAVKMNRKFNRTLYQFTILAFVKKIILSYACVKSKCVKYRLGFREIVIADLVALLFI